MITLPKVKEQCQFRRLVTSGTVQENSKLPLNYWFAVIHFLKVDKKIFSAF